MSSEPTDGLTGIAQALLCQGALADFVAQVHVARGEFGVGLA